VALTRTTRVSGQGEFVGTSFLITGTFTPSDNSLLVVIGGLMGDGTTSTDLSDDATIVSTAGLTFTRRVNVGDAQDYNANIVIWTAPVTTGVSQTLTIDCGANSLTLLWLSVVDYTDYDTTTPTGVTATDAALASNGAASLTLSGAPASTSEIIGGRVGVTGGTGTFAATTALTEIHDLGLTDNGGFQTQARAAGSTSTSFDWTDIASGTAVLDYSCVGAALEIRQAGGGGGATSYPNRRRRSNLTFR